MRITIRLLASYRLNLPDEAEEQACYVRDVPASTRAREVLADLHLPPNDPYTILVNGRHADGGRLLRDGDTIAVFPAVGGG